MTHLPREQADTPPATPEDMEDVLWALFAAALACIPLGIAAWFVLENWALIVGVLPVTWRN